MSDPFALDPAGLLAVTLASVAAGAVNALAGGGTLLTFPVLTALGMPALAANITNTVALCPGHVGATLAQREGLRGQGPRLARVLPAGALGGLLGGLLLLSTGEKAFRDIVPVLLLAASGLLASQDRVRGWLLARASRRAVGLERSRGGGEARKAGSDLADGHEWMAPAAVAVASVYGGYFGAGLGVVLLAALGAVIDEPLPRLNAVKTFVSLVVNVAAAVFFVFSGGIDWTVVSVMSIGALLGGALGGRLVTRVDPVALRRAIIAIGLVLSAVYFAS